MGFAQNLKYLMDKRGLSNYKLSKELPCSQTTVANWLDGVSTPQRRTMLQIANYLGVPLEWLNGESDEIEPPPAEPEADDPVKRELFEIIRRLSPAKVAVMLDKAKELEKF